MTRVTNTLKKPNNILILQLKQDFLRLFVGKDSYFIVMVKEKEHIKCLKMLKDLVMKDMHANI